MYISILCYISIQGAYYTFTSWELNHVPICLYLMTHAYFMFYHSLANVVLRRVVRLTATKTTTSGKNINSDVFSSKARKNMSLLTYIAFAVTVLVLAVVTAFMETLTIANFKYYTFVDKGKMYRSVTT